MKTIQALFLIFFINSFSAQNTKIESIKVTYNFIDHKEFREKRLDSLSKTKKALTPIEKEMSENINVKVMLKFMKIVFFFFHFCKTKNSREIFL